MDLLGAMGAGRLLFGLLITGTFANLFYPDVRVTLYEDILETKRGLHFPLTFTNLDPYILCKGMCKFVIFLEGSK